MNNDQFGALIKVKISTTSTELDSQIKVLSGQIKEVISVKLNIDSKDIQLITEKIKEAQNKASSGGKNQIKVGSFDEASREMNRMMSDFDKISAHFKSLGQNVQVKQVFSSADESLKKFEVSVDRINGKIKETSNFSVNVKTNKNGEEEMTFAKIALASKESAEKVIKDSNTKAEATNKEISAVDRLILEYNSATISAKQFIEASTKMFTSGKMDGQTDSELREREKLYAKLKTAQIEYNKDTSEPKTKSSAIEKVTTEIDRLILKYKSAEISAKEFMDAGLKISNSGKLSGNNDAELAQRIKLLNALKTAQKEYDSVIGQEGKINSAISNNVYAQQKQALESIYSLLIKKIDAEKKGQIELSAELQKQIRLEAEKYAIATKSIRSGGLTDSAKEVELLQKKISLQNELNIKKAKEADISRQNANISSSALATTKKEAMSLGASFKEAFEKFPIWMITATVYMQMINAFREGISTVIDLNSAITTIRMTMDMTSGDMDNLTSSSQKMAKEMGIAISEVLNAVKVYANMNESVDSILEKTKADIMLATASGMSTTDTTDAIQAILNQFELDATGSAERIADTLEKVSANMPMDFQRGIKQIVDGIRVSGTVAREAGFDLERYESVLGAIIARTRLGGSQVGNALKTVFARLGRVSDPTEASTEDISKSETAYRKLGIEIRDALTGDFRDVPDVLDELSLKWDGLTKIQKNYIAEVRFLLAV